jgi:hypothetical protein
MANYMKIPLPSNPPRSMVTGVGSLTASITTNTADAVDQVATPTAFTTSGIGTGGVADVTIAGNTVTVISVTNGGEGYAVGDTLTFSTTVIGGTVDVIVTLVLDDLIAIEGTATDPFRAIPIEDVAFIRSTGITVGVITTSNYDASAGAPLSYTVTLDDAPITTSPHIIADLADGVNKASQAENSVPSVIFDNDAEAIDVDYA